MIIRKLALPRRAVLRGLGATLALPFLDAMVPALVASTRKPVRRFGAFYVGNGMSMQRWTPSSTGTLALSPILEPLAGVQDKVVVFSGLDNKLGEVKDGGPHPAAQTTWLTGARAKRTEGPDIHAGPSVDQLLAREFGKETQLASLEVAIESVDLLGGCSQGYSCAYNNTISWRDATTPLPMENSPRALFERLFGASDSTDPAVRLADIRKDQSLLDSVLDDVASLNRQVGPSDRQKLDQYLDAVRSIERRLVKAEEQSDLQLPVMTAPAAIPESFEEHARLMADLLALAYQVDLTRVFTFLLAREASVLAYPEIGISEPHHPLSHHGNSDEKLAMLAKLNAFHVKQFAYLVETLSATQDGDGTLLDQTVLLYGSGMSDSNIHIPFHVPTLLVAGGGTGIKGGRHLSFAEATPLTNLQLGVMESLGMPMEQFGDSNGELNLLTDL